MHAYVCRHRLACVQHVYECACIFVYAYTYSRIILCMHTWDVGCVNTTQSTNYSKACDTN